MFKFNTDSIIHIFFCLEYIIWSCPLGVTFQDQIMNPFLSYTMFFFFFGGGGGGADATMGHLQLPKEKMTNDKECPA